MEKREETYVGTEFAEFVDVVRQLRKKCPWDSVQTHESLLKYLENETREVMQAVEEWKEDLGGSHLCEELGDVLLLVVLHSILAEEEGLFTIEEMIAGIAQKMRFRHPKIFLPENKELINLSWEELKKQEKLLKTEVVTGKSEKT